MYGGTGKGEQGCVSYLVEGDVHLVHQEHIELAEEGLQLLRI